MNKLRSHLPYLFWGLGFGFVIARCGAVRFDYIRDMFLLKDFQLYGVIGGAIAVGLPLFWLLERREKAARASKVKGAPMGRPYTWPHRRMTPGTLPGAALFGLGWAVTGTCPGPAAVQLGQGHWVALATIAGIFIGNLAYEKAHRRWFHWRPDSCS